MARCRHRAAPASPSPLSSLRSPPACSPAPRTRSPRPDWSPPRLLPHLPPPRLELHRRRPVLALLLFSEVVTTTDDAGCDRQTCGVSKIPLRRWSTGDAAVEPCFR